MKTATLLKKQNKISTSNLSFDEINQILIHLNRIQQKQEEFEKVYANSIIEVNIAKTISE
jgi:phage gp16-like protein